MSHRTPTKEQSDPLCGDWLRCSESRTAPESTCSKATDTPGLGHEERLRRIGEAVLAGARRPRRDALARLIEAALTDDIDMKWTDLLQRLPEYDDPDDFKRIVEEIGDDGRVYWIGTRGRERTTSLKSFRNRVSSTRTRLIRQLDVSIPDGA